VTLWLVGRQAIELLLGGEAFDAEDVATTTMLLGAFALSVPLEALIQLLSRAIYSTHDTILPVLASVTGLVVTVGAVELLADSRGIVALPLAFAAGLAVRLVLLLAALAVRTRRISAAAASAG
jgi:peptidoglycan biosynthesis protein MviN/MurJ (putative lipid II flippase)